MSENGDVRVVPVTRAPVAMTSRGVQLTSMDDAWRFCEAISGTPLAPKNMDAKSIFGVVQSGAELGLTPFRALANMKIINGRVGPMGALAKAKVREAGVLEKGTGFKETFTGVEFEDDFAAHFTTHRAGEGAALTTSFSVADAKRANLWDKKSRDGRPGPWVQYPKRMLMWRAIGFHMDDYYADVLLGFHIAEVLEDYPEGRVVAVMEPVETPAADPLLDDLDAKHAAELKEVEDQLQPPGTGVGGRDLHLEPSAAERAEDVADLVVDGEKVDAETGEFVDTGGPELNTGFNDLVGPDGEAITKIPRLTTDEHFDRLDEKVDRDVKAIDAELAAEAAAGEADKGPVGQASVSQSPLAAVMAEKTAEAPPMSEEEAMADLVRDGVISEDELEAADPSNKAEEGEEV